MSEVYTKTKFDLSKLDISKFRRHIELEFDAAALEAETYAKLNAPVDMGTHSNLIKGTSEVKENRVIMKLAAHSDYAAYLEFGTGQFAASYVSTLPKELQEYAMTFFVNGKGRLPARPHLVPAFERAVKELKEHLKAYAVQSR